MSIAMKCEETPVELAELLELVRGLPYPERAELEERVLDVIEQARFRARAMALARGGLEQLRLELSLSRFDLDLTRTERDESRGLACR